MSIDLSTRRRSIDQRAAFTHINQNSITAASAQPPIKANVIMFSPFKLTEDYIEITFETTVITGESNIPSGLGGSVARTDVSAFSYRFPMWHCGVFKSNHD